VPAGLPFNDIGRYRKSCKSEYNTRCFLGRDSFSGNLSANSPSFFIGTRIETDQRTPLL
jgi:hypothetical protein